MFKNKIVITDGGKLLRQLCELCIPENYPAYQFILVQLLIILAKSLS